jgi:hypothetical protein
LLKKIIDENI